MKNRVAALIVPVIIVLLGCEDDPAGVRNGPVIDKLRLAVLEDSIYADRLSPNYENPGYYIIRSEFSFELNNTSTVDSIFGIVIESTSLFQSSDDTYLGIIDFDEQPFCLAPGEKDTIDIVVSTGQNDIHEAHCDLPFYYEIRCTSQGGTEKTFLDGDNTLYCFP